MYEQSNVPVRLKYIYTTHFQTSNQFIALKSFYFLIYIIPYTPNTVFLLSIVQILYN